MTIHVLLADDHAILRSGLRSLIEKQPDMQIAGEAHDGRSAVKLVRQLNPDVVIMDIGMPEMNGIEATRQLRAENARVKIIALSMHADRRFIIEMFDAGAQGYLLKDCAFDELILAIRTLQKAPYYLSSDITGIVIEDYVRRISDDQPSASSFPAITHRERQVLKLLAEGKTTKLIAADLNVSVKTIETHRSQIMEKLDLHSIAELTKFAIREGITSLDR